MTRVVRLFIGLLFTFSVHCALAQEQLRISASLPNPVCAGQNLTVSYSSNQAGQLSVRLNGQSIGGRNTVAGNNQTITATVPINQAAGQYNVSLVNVSSDGGTTTTYMSGTVITTVNAALPPPSVTTPATYCQMEAAGPLSATPTAGGNSLLWYSTNAPGENGSSTPPKPLTDQAGTFPYYVSQTGPNSCESNRAQISVIVNPKPDKPVTMPLSACYNATNPPSITSGVTASGSLKWYMQQTGGNPISTPVLTTDKVGAVTYYVSQTNQFNCESDRAAITFTVNGLPAAPTIPAQTTLYCQNAPASPLQAIPLAGASLNWYTAQQGGTASPTLTPSTTDAIPKTYYVSQTDANGCETAQANRASITITTVSNPTMPMVSTPVTYCQFDTSLPLSATPTTTNTLRWYGMNASGGTPQLDAPKPPTDTPTPLYYYVSQIDGNQCEGQRATITVVINAKPPAPVISPSNVTVCQNATSASLTKGVTATGTLKWYTSQTGGTASFTEPQLSTANPGPQSDYYVSQTINGCESDRSPIHLIVIALPPPPTVSSDAVLVCQGTLADPLSATPSTGGTLIWYDPVTGATSNSIRPRTDVPTDINNPTLYPVSQTVSGCEGPKASVRVVTIAKPAPPTVSQSLTVCQFATPASLTTVVSGQNLKWYTALTGGTALAGTPIPPTDQAKMLVYYVSQTNQNNCEGDRATVMVDVRAKPNPPSVTSSSVCANRLVPLTATFDPNAVPNWYGTNANGIASQTAPTPTTAVVGAPVTYYVSQSINGCESDKANFTVTVLPQPSPPTVSPNPVLLCQGTAPTTLTATASGTLNWYTMPTGGTPSPTITIQPTNPGPTPPYFVSQVDGNNCESARTQVNVTVNPKPVTPTVTASLTACQTTTANSITLTASGSGLKWYSDANSTTVIPTPVISTTAPGTVTYYVSQTDLTTGCESDRVSITTTIIQTPAAPTASTIYYCLNYSQPSALTAVATPGGILNFYAPNAAASSASIIPSTSSTGTTSYSVSQTISGCESPRITLAVTIRSLPLPPTVAANNLVSLCQNSPPIALTATASGTLNWYTSSSGGTASPVAYPPTTSSGLLPTYYVSQTDGNQCESLRTPVTVFIKTQPAAPIVATNTLTYCQSTTPVTLTAVTIGTPNWYTVPTNGTATSSVMFVPSTPAQNTYYVSQTFDGCESARIPIVVTVQATPLVPTVSANPIFCQGITGSISPSSVTAPNGGVLTWYMQELGGTGSTTPPSVLVNNATTFTYFVSQSVGTCESARVKLVATVKAPPDLPTVIPQVSACQNGTAVLTAALKGGVNLNWYSAPVGGSGSTVTPTVDTRSPGPVYYYVSQTDANGCESSRAVITVRVNAAPSAPSVSSVSFCQGSAQASLPAIPTIGTLNYYTTPVGGAASTVAPPLNTANPTTTPYYVSQTDPSTGCESTRSTLLVTVFATPAAPTVPAIAPVCQNSTPIGLQALGTNLKWYADGTSTATVSPIVPTSAAVPVSFYVSQTINGCESARTIVTVLVNPLPLAPVVTANVSGCQDVAALPLTAAGTNLQWYDQSDFLISPPTPVTRVDVATVYVYRVTQTVNGCTSPKASIQYTVNVTPLPGVVTPVSVCQTSTASALQVTSGTNLKWYDPSGAITTTAPIPAITATSTITSYSVTQTVNNCESRKARIDVTTTAPATAKIEGNPTIYLGSSATLTLTLSGQGPYSYTLSDGTASIIPADVGSATTIRSVTVTPASATTATYTITRIANACGNGVTSGSAVVTVLTPTITTIQLSNSVVCASNILNTTTVSYTATGNFTSDSDFTVEIGSAAVDPLTRQYTTVSVPFRRGSSVIATIPPSIAPGQYAVRIRASNGNFPIVGTTSPTILTVKAPPTATLSVNRDSIYQRQGVILTFTFTGEPTWTGRYQAGSVIMPYSATANISSFTLTPSATTTYKLLDVRDSGCGMGSIAGVDSARVKVNLLLAADDPLGNSVKVYPVPTDGAVTVAVDLAVQNQPVQLRLVGSDGRIRQELTTKKQQTILDLDKEPAGVYLLQITIGDRSTVRRILKR